MRARHKERRRSLTYVAFAAVQDRLVAPAVLADTGERLDDAQAELLALLVLCDGDILDVADGAKAVDAVKESVSLAWEWP